MYFNNEKRRQAFEAGIKKANKKDKETLCLIYLLSADSCLCGFKSRNRQRTRRRSSRTRDTKRYG